MSKIQTKKAAEALGRQHAETINKAFPRTWQEVDAMSGHIESRSAALDQLGAVPVEVEKFRDAYVDAFILHLSQLWCEVSKAHTRGVQIFQRACQCLTQEQAVAKVKALIESMHIRGARVSDGCGMGVYVERAWGVSASLYVKFDRDYDYKVINPDNDTQCAGRYNVVVELSWSSTTRRVSDAVASIKLYQELTEAAAEIEAVMSHESVVWTFGIPEPVEETSND